MNPSNPSEFRGASSAREHSADERPVFPIEDADRCVKCALCLPHCPTYRLSRDESESPRGRIALMQALAEGELDYSERLAGHLDRCLGCRNCEPVCPANVPYGRLIDAGRAMLVESGHARRRDHAAASVMAGPRRLRLAMGLARLYQRSGLQWLARHSLLRLLPRLSRLDRLLPPIPRRRRRPVETGQGSETVQLFLGCIAEHLDPGVSDAATRVLASLGFRIEAPAGQTCCGAPDQHNGRPGHARTISRRNVDVFDGESPILASASGCTATLKEYPEIHAAPSHRDFAERVTDLCAFIDRQDFEAAGLKPAPLNGRVLIYVPCSQRNVVGETEASRRLLERIPTLDVTTLDTRGRCCGAAGTYLVSQPENAEALGRELAERVVAERPDVVVTTNIGCKLQLRSQLAGRLPHCEIMHPVELLARQLDQAPARQ